MAASATPVPAPLPADVHQLSLPTPFRIGAVIAWLLRGEPLTLVDQGPLMPAIQIDPCARSRW